MNAKRFKIMNSAMHRLEDLKTLTELLDKGEKQKFFDLFFSKPKESLIYQTAMEEIILSSKKRELIQRFARIADENLINKTCKIIDQHMHELTNEIETENSRFLTITKKTVDALKALRILSRLRNDVVSTLIKNEAA